MHDQRKIRAGRVPSILVPLLCLALAPHIAAAAEPHEGDPDVFAMADSVVIATFRDLPDGERRAALDAAAVLVRRAADAPFGPEAMRLWRAAAGAAPSETGHWVGLAECALNCGYATTADSALATARNAIRFLAGDERRAAIGRYALINGWSLFARGRWRESREFAELAIKGDAGASALLLRALDDAQIRNRLEDADEAFRRARSTPNARLNHSWVRVLYFHFHGYPFDEVDVQELTRKNTGEYEWDVLRWRDFGLYCEANGGTRTAVTYYEKAARSLGDQARSWLTRREALVPGDEPQVMPFWTNPQDMYVTGSLAAYLGWAHAELRSATDPARQDLLADRILEAYGRTIRRWPTFCWAILYRTEALLHCGRLADAEREARYARDSFRDQGIEDPALDRVQGHVLLAAKKFGRARPMVQAAVAAFPADAVCWTDLGLVEIGHGDRSAARRAFDKALALDPSLPAAWYNRAVLLLQRGDAAGALADLERAGVLAPDDERIGDMQRRVEALLAAGGG